ncbi:hypothetical protein [Cellulomonas sp. HZM]|uniref:hypothetical protein n=1 Tax=Cellulomonas sp. HZM TaxID=1454010 RepID=UPI000493605B|nr:hypothetical protein [Cellulomonas sp. HZM]
MTTTPEEGESTADIVSSEEGLSPTTGGATPGPGPEIPDRELTEPDLTEPDLNQPDTGTGAPESQIPGDAGIETPTPVDDGVARVDEREHAPRHIADPGPEV